MATEYLLVDVRLSKTYFRVQLEQRRKNVMSNRKHLWVSRHFRSCRTWLPNFRLCFQLLTSMEQGEQSWLTSKYQAVPRQPPLSPAHITALCSAAVLPTADFRASQFREFSTRLLQMTGFVRSDWLSVTKGYLWATQWRKQTPLANTGLWDWELPRLSTDIFPCVSEFAVCQPWPFPAKFHLSWVLMVRSESVTSILWLFSDEPCFEFPGMGRWEKRNIRMSVPILAWGWDPSQKGSEG